MFPVGERRFICSEKNCKKNLLGFRKLFNDVYSDELNRVRIQQNRSYQMNVRSTQNDKYCPSCLNRRITNAFKKTNRSEKFLRQACKVMKLYKLAGKNKFIRQRGLDVLYLQRAGSTAVRDFLFAMDFEEGHLLSLFTDVFKYVLYHANRTGFNLWSPPPGLDPINSSVRCHMFEKTAILLQYTDAPRFCETSYEHMKLNINCRRLGLSEDALRMPVENGLTTRERHFLILQIFDVICAESSDGLKALQLLWRSMPHPFVNLDELTFLFPALKDTPHMEKIHSCVNYITGEETLVYEPRKLKHYCRTTIRKGLSETRKLSTGISELRLPPSLQSFLRLEN
ncbi:hypothetical protein AVEN_131025-1 [Araneus ventricosus]|uniref:SOCS box domain-containing protein n=1 Tax=Araneus ventricosus TaxID=182803 RepID=A0A4Y2W9A8_ARAVE|nr:hypothetical protein AVEN_131025-1 [Araneus ventricosus]